MQAIADSNTVDDFGSVVPPFLTHTTAASDKPMLANVAAAVDQRYQSHAYSDAKKRVCAGDPRTFF